MIYAVSIHFHTWKSVPNNNMINWSSKSRCHINPDHKYIVIIAKVSCRHNVYYILKRTIFNKSNIPNFAYITMVWLLHLSTACTCACTSTCKFLSTTL